MPEPTGAPLTEAEAAPEGRSFFDELDTLVTAGDHVWERGQSDEELSPNDGVAPTTDAGTDGPTDQVLESAPTEETPDPVAAATAEGAEPEATAEGAEAGDEPGRDGLTRRERGALLTQREQERDEARARAEKAERELADLRGESGASSDPAAAEATQADQQAASTPSRAPVQQVTPERLQHEVLEFIGMAPPVDDEGKPIPGAEPLFVRLDREAKTDGIGYEDEQKLYREMTERHGMTGKIYSLARNVAYQEIVEHLVDPELGIDEAAVSASGGIPAWKQRYRQALEQSLRSQYEGQSTAAVDQMRSDYEAKLAELTRRLEDTAGKHSHELATARGVRSPVAAGRSVSGNGAYAGSYQSSGDLTTDLADFLRETDAGR